MTARGSNMFIVPFWRERARSRVRIISPLELTIDGWVGFFLKKKCPDVSQAKARVREGFHCVVNWFEGVEWF